MTKRDDEQFQRRLAAVAAIAGRDSRFTAAELDVFTVGQLETWAGRLAAKVELPIPREVAPPPRLLRVGEWPMPTDPTPPRRVIKGEWPMPY